MKNYVTCIRWPALLALSDDDVMVHTHGPQILT